MSTRGLRRYVADLIRRRRPTPFSAQPEDAAELRAAIELQGAVPDGVVPSDAFIDKLHDRLRSELAPPPDQRQRSRRRMLLQTGAVAAASAAIGAVAASTLRNDPSPSQAGAPTVEPNAGTWQPVTSSEGLPDGAVQAFEFATIIGFVQRTGDQLLAVSGVCTHLGCRLALDLPRKQLTCPCHRTAFATTGEVVYQQLPNPLPRLPRIPVREADGEVQVFVPKATE